MSDQFVKVATFSNSFESQLAKNLLENEGIAAMMSGEMSDEMFRGVGDQIVLLVHEDEVQRAAGILAAAAAEAKLDDDWENQAEAGVWTCTICGEPISNRLSICYSCQSPREGIRASAPRDCTAIQADPATLPTGEEVQKREEIALSSLPAPALPPRPVPAMHYRDETDELPLPSSGDDLARRAFLATIAAVLMPLVQPLAWYYIFRVVNFSGELSPKGTRYFHGALLLEGLVVICVLALCSGLIR